MTDLQEFYTNERLKWDQISRKKLQPDEIDKLRIKAGDDFHAVAARDTVMVGVNDFLGNVKGKQVLEVGCGSGKLSALLARSGAHVTAFDLSPASIDVAKTRRRINRLRMNLTVAAGERLPFKDESFDIVFGRAILHHLKAELSAPEIHRVLKKGGKALFVEPMGMNPLLNFARDHVPYPDKNPVGDDQPLNYTQIREWGTLFPKYHYREVHFLGMLERALGYKMAVKLPILHKIDGAILKTMPFMGRFFRYVVMYMEK